MATTNQSVAQRHELGLGLGAFNYTGDLNRGYPLNNLRPGLTGYYRLNFNPYISFKLSLTGGMLSGSDESDPIDAFAEQRQGSFDCTLLELGGSLEYNFINYKSEYSLVHWSPYLFVGLGGFSFFGGDQDLHGSSTVQPNIPFGVGFKYGLSPYITINMEFGFRKLFFDYLDGYSEGDLSIKNYQYGNIYDKDWYNFLGLSVSYTFYSVPCPHDFY